MHTLINAIVDWRMAIWTLKDIQIGIYPVKYATLLIKFGFLASEHPGYSITPRGHRAIYTWEKATYRQPKGGA